MGKPTATKVKKKPADFKRPKRKVGRKAPQAANVTSVAISSRRINMLEQSVLQDKGDAVTHRHLSLQDLMTQIGHYNAHMRQRALQGLRELAQTHASNVLANVSIVLERYLRTFVDEEAIVRDAAIATWKVLIPILIEGKSLKPFAKLIAMYFCSGLTHLQIGIRQDTLKAIDVVLDHVPELISVDAGLEQLGRLIENFRDLVAAAPTQGIKVTNTYDLLSTSTAKSSSDSGDVSKKTKSKSSSQALALRFAALNVLHKLLQSVHVDVTVPLQTVVGVRHTDRMGPVVTRRALLLYPTPQLVVGNQSERLRNVGFWQEKSRSLLSPLLDLWLECLESDSIETLSDEYVVNMQKIVESTTVILSVNVDAIVTQQPRSDEPWIKVLGRIQDQLMARFPMFPTSNLAAGGDAYLSRWYGINVAIATFASVVPQRHARSMDGSSRVASFVTSALAKYAASDELRALSGTHAIVRALLAVLRLVLATKKDASADREQLLASFTALYVKTSSRSMTFRICTEFVIDRLSDLTQWPSWPVVLQWLTCFGHFLGSLETTHMGLGRQCLLTMISVMKQLPVEHAQGPAIESVLSSLEQFFNLTDVDSTTSELPKRFRLNDLAASDQLEFVSLVYHLPRYPVSLLRALASCCKSRQIDVHAKSFLMDILHQRRDALDLAHFVSFLMSGVLGRVTTTMLADNIDDDHDEHLQLVRHVCRILLSMQLGASLSQILAPALSRQIATLESMAPIDLHTLLLVYGACLASVRPSLRRELPAELIQDVHRVALGVLRVGVVSAHPPRNRSLLADLTLTIAMTDDLVRRVLASVLATDGAEEQATTTTHVIQSLQMMHILVRAEDLQDWFRRSSTLVNDLLSAFEAATTSSLAASEEATRLLRQIRGDLALMAVGSSGQ